MCVIRRFRRWSKYGLIARCAVIYLPRNLKKLQASPSRLPPSLPPRRPSAAPDAGKKWAVPAFPALYRHFGADRGAGERALLPAAAMSSLFCSRHAFRKIKISETRVTVNARQESRQETSLNIVLKKDAEIDPLSFSGMLKS